MPGPGQYDQHSSIGKGPAVSIRGRVNQELRSDIPGPGSYDANQNLVKERILSAQMGKYRRDFLTPPNEEMNKPGPG